MYHILHLHRRTCTVGFGDLHSVAYDWYTCTLPFHSPEEEYSYARLYSLPFCVSRYVWNRPSFGQFSMSPSLRSFVIATFALYPTKYSQCWKSAILQSVLIP